MDQYLKALKDVDNNLDPVPVQFNFVSMRPYIDASKLYSFLQTMPKGALLHSHDLSSLDMHLYVNATHLPGCLINQAENGALSFVPGEGFVPVSTVRDSWPGGAAVFDAALYRNFTILTYEDGVDVTGDELWDKFQPIFDRLKMLYRYRPVFTQFFSKMFDKLWADGVIRWEIRTSLAGIYDAEGKEYTQGEALQIVMDELQAWKATPDLDGKDRQIFSFGVILQSSRGSSVEVVTEDLTSAFNLREQFPDLILGFDLVGHEDPGQSLFYWAPTLIKVQQELLSSGNYSGPMPYFFHAGESNRVVVQDNLVDAILLNTSRIGHGFGIQGYPSLWPMVNQQRVLVESCPLSNQLLGLVVDQRNHPVGEMLRHALAHFATPHGISSCEGDSTERTIAALPASWQELIAHDARVAKVLRNNILAPALAVSINNDDPGFWGVDALVSYDWYAAVLGWDLSLGGIKQLAVDSIVGSAASVEQRAAMLLQWGDSWDSWIHSLQQQ